MDGHALLARAGGLRDLYADVDWAGTPLGPVESWSEPLGAAVDLLLAARIPVTLFWGPELVLVYNEAYVPLIGDKHPTALGSPAREVFPEAWEQIGPMMQGVLGGGDTVFVENGLVQLERRGFLEECYFTFSYSGVRDASGEVLGVIDLATETTRQVMDRRRLSLLVDLEDQLADAADEREAIGRALAVLRTDPGDVAWAEVRDSGYDGSTVTVTGSGGDRTAWLPLGTGTQDRTDVAVIGLPEQLHADAAYLGFLGLVARALARALELAAARRDERSLSEALQRSLLTEAPEPDHLQVAVRYVPAAVAAQIGGDWYDGFVDPDGCLTLVVGDVAGHDQAAAVVMAQVRSLLRGLAYTSGGAPAEVLARLDAAMPGLGVGSYATAILARIEQTDSQHEQGVRTFRWSNAGHPPPVLLEPDGRAYLLDTEPDLVLGIAVAGDRSEHAVTLAAGSTVLLFTDGLVERRGADLDAGLEWLRSTVQDHQHLGAQALADLVLDGVVDAEDDVALVVLTASPQPS